MTRAERHRTAAAIRRANRKALAEFEQMTGGIIEGEIVRQGDAPSEQLRDALARFFVSASWHGGRCMLCRAQMHPPASWPASFFAAYSAPRTLVASFCAAR